MPKVKIEDLLFERIKQVAKRAGYATVDEFITHVLEKELSVLESADSDESVTERLRGLGYLE